MRESQITPDNKCNLKKEGAGGWDKKHSDQIFKSDH